MNHEPNPVAAAAGAPSTPAGFAAGAAGAAPAPGVAAPAPRPADGVAPAQVLVQVVEIGGEIQLHTGMQGQELLALLVAVVVRVSAELGQPLRVEPAERKTAGGIVLPGPGASPRKPVKRPQ